jgi:group I intron endonuclease
VTAGVYAITAPSGSQYVGSATDIEGRWSKHRSDLRRGVHHCAPLQAAFAKYGEALRYSALIVCGRDMLTTYEQAALDALQPAYNVLKTARSHLGAKRSAESCERIRKATTGRKATPETIEKLRLVHTGKTATPETREKMRAARLGRKMSDESRARLSASRYAMFSARRAEALAA